jgi:phospholipid/cholesterol/gamma-HCH transport system substrate-binding protein
LATKKVKIKVGMFMITCISLIIASALYISGTYGSSGTTYWLEFDASVLGVYEGGIVQYLGVPVGKVSDISVTANNRAHIEIVINPNKVALYRGVEAELVMYSLAAGTMAIELSGGQLKDGPLPAGGQIPSHPSAFSAISTKVEELMDDASSIVDKFNEALSGMESGALTEIIERAQVVMEEAEGLLAETREAVTVTKDTIAKVEEKIDPIVEEVVALSTELRGTSDDAGAFLKVATKKAEELDVAGLGKRVDDVLAEISELAGQLNDSVSTLDASSASLLHEADNVEFSVRATLTETTDTLVALEALVKQLKEDPSSLLRGKSRIKER